MFQTAQWASLPRAAASLAQKAARQAKSDGALARLAGELHDLMGEWRAKNNALISARAEPLARRNAQTEVALFDRLAAIDASHRDIDKSYQGHYAALTKPEPLNVAYVQALLAPTKLCCLSSTRGNENGSRRTRRTW